MELDTDCRRLVVQPMPIEELGEQLQGFLARIRAETQVPGIAAAISVGGRRVYAAAGTRLVDEASPLASDDRFHLGCATKLLLAIVALELACGGKLDLNAPIGDYLAELGGTVHGRTVRVANLLSHTSGYRGTNIMEHQTRDLTWPAFIDYLREAPQLFTPGSVFSYEHTESVLLGTIIERVSGKPSLELVSEMILKPLGISHGLLGSDSADARPAGQHDLDGSSGRFKRLDRLAPLPDFWLPAFSNFTLSLLDLVTIMESTIGLFSPISAATLNLLLHPVVRLPPAAGGPLRELLPVAFGLGAAQLRDGFHGNSGLTHGQCLGLRFNSHTGVSVAVGLNAAVPYLRDFVLAAICRDLTAPSAAHERQRFELDFVALAGRYLGPGRGTVVARLDKERLVCEIGRDGSTQKVTVELVLDDDGELVLRSAAPQLSMAFFREPSSGDVGLMIGLSAYKRIAARTVS